MHIPFFCWSCNFTAAFETFHQENFTSSRIGGPAVGMEKWVGGVEEDFGLMTIPPCPTGRVAMTRPYMVVGI